MEVQPQKETVLNRSQNGKNNNKNGLQIDAAVIQRGVAVTPAATVVSIGETETTRHKRRKTAAQPVQAPMSSLSTGHTQNMKVLSARQVEL